MQDPVIIGWAWTIGALAAVAVAVPLLRLAIAGTLYAIAVASGHARLRAAAIRALPRTAHVVGSLVLGTAAVAAPALAAEQSHANDIGLDRDGSTGGRATRSTVPSLDRAGGTTPQQAIAHRNTAVAAPAATGPASASRPSNPTTSTAASSGSATARPGASVAGSQNAQVTRLYIVQVGDTLWDIAHEQLDHPSDAQVTETWKAIWRANRAVIGDDPALIHPGDRLELGGQA